MSIGFLLAAGAMTLAAALLLARPLLMRSSAGRPARAATAAVFAVLALGAAALYAAWSNYSWQPPAADSPEAMVARLARRLERDPNDLQGWLRLGRSQLVLQQYPLALRAYQRADRLAGGKSAEALLGMGEALVLADDGELAGRGGKFFEQALVLEPQSGKALFFSAAAALRRGELPLARERFTTLLALEPPENVRPILEQQIAAIDQQLGQGGGAAANSPAPGASDTPAAPVGPAVQVNVDIAPALRAGVRGDAPLFVIVRDPANRGPPLAVKRLPARFPQAVELTVEDAMVPGRAFAAGQDVEVVARIAQSGSPTAVSGDPFGQARYQVGRDGRVRLVIDQRTP